MEINLLLIFMICAAVMAIESKDLISSVISLSAVGLGLSSCFLILKAPNLAITQLVVEILCVIILIRGTISKDLPLVKDGRWFFNTASTLLFIAVFLLFSFFALKELPVFGQPLMRLSNEYINSQASGNIVSAITLQFRNYDSLGEAGILFTALIAVLVVTRRTGKVHGR